MDIIIEKLNNMENGFLIIPNLNLTQLPESPLWEYVKYLYCYNNQITSLPDLPNVEHLNCSNNQLTCLPDLPNVKTLSCDNNQLTSLPDLPNVKYLFCCCNQLTTLPDLPNVNYLDCDNNPLIYNPENRKVFNAIFRIILVQKMFKRWHLITYQRQQERIYQIINKVSEFNVLPEEIKVYIVKFI